MNTPWGWAQHKTKLADGVVSCSTASHGGIWLSAERIAQLPDGLDNFLHDTRWWEEDCDWCVPYILFSDDIAQYGEAYAFTENLSQAYTTARRHHPEIIKS